MNKSFPHLADDGNGVGFTVTVEFVNRACIVSKEALATLSSHGNRDQDLMQVFLAFEANINGIARRLVAAGVPGNPLQISAKTIAASHAIR